MLSIASLEKNNFFIFETHKYLKNKTLLDIKNAQKEATKKVFKIKKIPFRSIEVLNRSESSIGELFTFYA